MNIGVREEARVACLAWWFWLGALNNKGERGQRYREETGASPLMRPARQNRHATQTRARVSPPIFRRLDGILSSLVALFVSIFLKSVRTSLMVISRELKDLLVYFYRLAGLHLN